MPRYKIVIEYDGTNISGWQRQPDTSSIQQFIEDAIESFSQEKVIVHAAGRTDAGLHAIQMFAHFDMEKIFDSDKIISKLNSFLPNDISVKRIFKVKEDTHARFTAIARTYQYFISNKKDIFNQNLHLVLKDLDVERMNDACQNLLGEQDFTSFSKVNTDTFTNNCDITHAQWKHEGDHFVFTISSNRFLRNMVRSIVGTLIDIGTGKIEVTEIKKIIEKKDRCKAGVSVPAKALFLTQVKYPDNI